jgi:hypothetical protein
MSDADEKNDNRPNGKGAGPTRSFDSSAGIPDNQAGQFPIELELGRRTEVVLRTYMPIRPLDVLNMYDYSTGVFSKRG